MTKYHIGCGPIYMPGWVNVDKSDANPIDVRCNCIDLRGHTGDNAVDVIFTCHMLEHLPWRGEKDGVERFLYEAHRMLKPGGTMRIIVPDLMKVAAKYVAGDDLKEIYGPQFDVGPIDQPATRFMYFARGWNHTVLFDWQLLSHVVSHAGFVNIRQMGFNESLVPELQNIDRFPAESLMLECDKAHLAI